jgi:hypothetical protein
VWYTLHQIDINVAVAEEIIFDIGFLLINRNLCKRDAVIRKDLLVPFPENLWLGFGNCRENLDRNKVREDCKHLLKVKQKADNIIIFTCYVVCQVH